MHAIRGSMRSIVVVVWVVIVGFGVIVVVLVLLVPQSILVVALLGLLSSNMMRR